MIFIPFLMLEAILPTKSHHILHERIFRHALSIRYGPRPWGALKRRFNNDFDFLLDLALETQQQRYRLNLYRQAQNILNEEFPVIPLAHGVQFRVHDKSLKGFKSSPFNAQPFDRVERIH